MCKVPSIKKVGHENTRITSSWRSFSNFLTSNPIFGISLHSTRWRPKLTSSWRWFSGLFWLRFSFHLQLLVYFEYQDTKGQLILHFSRQNASVTCKRFRHRATHTIVRYFVTFLIIRTVKWLSYSFGSKKVNSGRKKGG